MDAKGAGDRPSVAVAEHELESLAPEVRPYMSVLSLNSFGFQPPPPSPPYSGGRRALDGTEITKRGGQAQKIGRMEKRNEKG
jgi:hypothetical protein